MRRFETSEEQAHAAGGIELLDNLAPEHLPAPALSNRATLDEKLLFLRRHPTAQPTVLGVGSSITMRSLYGAPFSEANAPERSFLNAGFEGAQTHQTREIGRFFMDLFPRVHTVVQLVVPPDFEDCTTRPATLFDVDDARAYVRGELSLGMAYLKYFNPHQLIPDAFTIAARRQSSTGASRKGRFYMDQYASMPMEMSVPELRKRHERLYAETGPLDEACFRELREWSYEVNQRGARLFVVVPPFSPVFLRNVANASKYTETFVHGLRETLIDSPAVLIDARSTGFSDEAFADAYHLLWPAARVFSSYVADHVRQLSGGPTTITPVKPST